jgi:hypothetical protein
MKKIFFPLWMTCLCFFINTANALSPEEWKTFLYEQGAAEETAEAIVNANAEWWPLLNPTQNKQLQWALESLSYYYREPLLTEHPEIAGLLATISDPDTLLRNLSSECLEHQLNYFLLYPDFSDRIVELLDNYEALFCDYARAGLAIPLFPLFANLGYQDYTYAEWLSDTLEEAYTASAEERLQMIIFLHDQGDNIRRRMREDNVFASRFSSIWRDFIEYIHWDTAKDSNLSTEKRGLQPSLLDAALPGLWDYLMLPDGVALYQKFGVAPLPLFFGQNAYPKNVHPQVSAALLSGDDILIYAINFFAYNSDFANFLSKNLSSDLRRQGILQLLSACENQPLNCRTLSQWQQLENLALRRTIRPEAAPFGVPTGIWTVWQKLEDGRDVTLWDAAAATLDVAGAALDIAAFATTGGASSGLKLLGNTAVARGAGALGGKVAKQAAVSGLKQQVRQQAALSLKIDIAPLLQKFKPHSSKLGENVHQQVAQRVFKSRAYSPKLYMRQDAVVLLDTKPLLANAWKNRPQEQQSKNQGVETKAPDFSAFDSDYLSQDLPYAVYAQKLSQNRALAFWLQYLGQR